MKINNALACILFVNILFILEVFPSWSYSDTEVGSTSFNTVYIIVEEGFYPDRELMSKLVDHLSNTIIPSRNISFRFGLASDSGFVREAENITNIVLLRLQWCYLAGDDQYSGFWHRDSEHFQIFETNRSRVERKYLSDQPYHVYVLPEEARKEFQGGIISIRFRLKSKYSFEERTENVYIYSQTREELVNHFGEKLINQLNIDYFHNQILAVGQKDDHIQILATSNVNLSYGDELVACRLEYLENDETYPNWRSILRVDSVSNSFATAQVILGDFSNCDFLVKKSMLGFHFGISSELVPLTGGLNQLRIVYAGTNNAASALTNTVNTQPLFTSMGCDYFNELKFFGEWHPLNCFDFYAALGMLFAGNTLWDFSFGIGYSWFFTGGIEITPMVIYKKGILDYSLPTSVFYGQPLYFPTDNSVAGSRIVHFIQQIQTTLIGSWSCLVPSITMHDRIGPNTEINLRIGYSVLLSANISEIDLQENDNENDETCVIHFPDKCNLLSLTGSRTGIAYGESGFEVELDCAIRL
jgi:hypothetical protein